MTPLNPQASSTQKPAVRLVEHGAPPVTVNIRNPSVFWRIVFAQTAFHIQISNNLGGSKISWTTVADSNSELIIPEEYLAALQSLGTSPNLVSRHVVEIRSIPLPFTSYSDALGHVHKTLGMSSHQEWDPEKVRSPKKGWFSRR